MLAYRYHPDSPVVVAERISIPSPKPNEVLLKVAAAGLCHSALHVLHSKYRGTNTSLGDSKYTLGHESCGVAVKFGSDVPAGKFTEGDLYSVIGTNPCFNATKCVECATGGDNVCGFTQDRIGLGRDGGWSEYMSVPFETLVKVPAGVSAKVAAVATDALLTPYHGIAGVIGLKKSQNVLVIGLGGVGMNALAIAKHFGGKMYATDVKPEALKAAMELGIEAALPKAEIVALLTAPGAPRIDVAIDAVGIQSTFTLAQTLVGRRGRVLLLGLMEPNLTWHVAANVRTEIGLSMSFWGTRTELAEVLDLVASGVLSPQVTERPMSMIPESIEDLENGKVLGRLAFVP